MMKLLQEIFRQELYGNCLVEERKVMESQKIWKIESYIMADQGTREYQQDAACVQIDGNVGMAVLCDGMGGLNSGEKASNQSVKQFLRDMNEAWPVKNLAGFLKDEARRLDRMIYSLTDEKNKRLNAGTTIVSAVIMEKHLYWMSVGDSRLYLLRNGTLRRLTKDHNYKTMLQEKLASGKVDMDYYNSEISKGEALTSYLGLGNIHLVDANASPFALNEEDIILLCSDGLYKTLTEEQIQAVVMESGGCISIAGQRLIKTARRWGARGQDNTTVVLLKIIRDEND